MEIFDITYQLTISESETVDQKIESICLEQSVELPRQILSGKIEKTIVGEFVRKRQLKDGLFEAVISWPLDNADDISQFLNILYGNISLQPGIRIAGAEWIKLKDSLFKGPRFGIQGIRKKYNIDDRALSATALKPLGSTADEIGDICYKFALGGIDLIKDDHGITNQHYAPFPERVKSCIQAILKAEDESGHRSRYFPNITAFAEESINRYKMAADLGADGVLLCPHITGLETMHYLAQMNINLPIIAHPAFSGALTTDTSQGLTPDFLYGQLWRALGADFVIYPNSSGRFSYSKEQCKAINHSARTAESPFKPSFPMPAGGLELEEIADWKKIYGPDTVFLLGGSLYEYSKGKKSAAEKLREILKDD